MIIFSLKQSHSLLDRVNDSFDHTTLSKSISGSVLDSRQCYVPQLLARKTDRLQIFLSLYV